MPIKTLTKTSPKMSVKTRAKTSIRKLTRTPSGIITVTLTKTTAQAPSKARRPSGAKMTAQAPSKARRPSGAQAPSKARRPSGATVTLTKSGGFRLRAYGPDAPDLRGVVPELLKNRDELGPDDDEECRTCLGNLRIRDGETGDLRRCLDCGGTGASS